MEADRLPNDFIAYDLETRQQRRFVRKGIDNWDVWLWSHAWAFVDNVGDFWVVSEYRQADQIFVHQEKIK